MTTALDIVTDAGARIGVYAPGEVLTAADSSLGLTVLNDLLDSLSTENLISFAILEQSAPLQGGVAQYTIGPGGTWNMPRPLRVRYGTGAAYLMDATYNLYAVDVVQRAEWNLIGNRALINSDIPTTMFYDPQYPLGVINVWPAPLIPYTLFWDSYLPLAELADLATPICLPAGYGRMLKLLMSAELWPYYKGDGTPVPQLLLAQGAQAKANVKRNNYRPYRAHFDRAILHYPQSSYNIYRGM